jgi:hypothetical protein
LRSLPPTTHRERHENPFLESLSAFIRLVGLAGLIFIQMHDSARAAPGYAGPCRAIGEHRCRRRHW